MTAARTVTATFAPAPTYLLTVTKTGNGTVTSNPAGINCGTDCTESYEGGKTVTLTATPAADSVFTAWGGACAGTAATAACTVTMDAAKTATATFATKADFVVTAIDITPANPAIGAAFTATVTVKNQGSSAGNGGYLDVWTDLTAVATCGAHGNSYQAVGTMAAGASKTLTFTGLRAGAGGSKTLRAFVNSNCQPPEVNTGNNQLVKGYVVGPLQLPNFVVSSLAVTPASPPVNTVFTASVTVTNTGAVLANGGYLDLWTHQPTAQPCGAVGNSWTAVGDLAPGASRTITFTGLRATTTGAKVLRAFVDSECAVRESSEADNQKTANYTIAP
jgi:subtilase family serine protease